MTMLRSSILVGLACSIILQCCSPSTAQSTTDYERIRDDILAWQQVPANAALCGTDPGGKTQALLKDYGSCTSGNFRIVNGCKVTDPTPINWNVGVLTSTMLECTGTLLTDKHVAVAAKCLEKLTSVKHVHVLINSTVVHNRYGQHAENGTNIFPAASFGVHPYFNGATFENNMGVVELEKPVPIGVDGIRPACLPKAAADLQTLRQCVMTSFGQTHAPAPGDTYTAPELALGLFDLTQHEVCEKLYPPYLRARQLCAIGERAGSSVHMCVGDFGAGLLCNINNLWTMVGMSSYTASDCKGPAAFNDMWSGFTEKNSSAPANNTTPAPETTTLEPTTPNATTTESPTTTEKPSTTEATTTTHEPPTTTEADGGQSGSAPQIPNVFIGIIQQYLKPFKQFAAYVG